MALPTPKPMERRNFIRMKSDATGRLIAPVRNSKGEFDMIMVDVADTSAFGVGIRSSRALPIDSFWHLVYEPNGVPTEIGLVVKRRSNMQEGLFHYGCEMKLG